MGVDCALVEGQPPNISLIQNDGFCDLEGRPCLKTRLYGSGFYDGNITCKITNRESSMAEVYYYYGKMVSAGEIVCPLPNVTNSDDRRSNLQNLTISVSNNNDTFSTPQAYTIYNSECVECTLQHGCHLKVIIRHALCNDLKFVRCMYSLI